MSVRAFVAIELPAQTRAALHAALGPAQRTFGHASIRWVPTENLHITLKFLGNIAATQLDMIKVMLGRSAQSCTPFDVQLGGIGCFPTWTRPSVLWVGLHAPAALATLQRSVEASLNQLGFPKEQRPYSPHLTIARAKSELSSDEAKQLQVALAQLPTGMIAAASVDSLHLFQSELRPAGARHSKLFSARLRSAAPDHTAGSTMR